MKKLFCILIISSILSSSLFLPIASAVDYDGHWAKADISMLIASGIITPDQDGNIHPDFAMPRYAFVNIVNKICGFSTKASVNFNDIADGKAYFQDFLVAKAAGYIKGDEAGNANPEGTITRAEVAVILVRVLNLSTTGVDTSKYNPADVPAWAAPSIAALDNAGIMKGNDDGTFAGDKQMTNAEGYTMAVRIMKNKAPTKAADKIISANSDLFDYTPPTAFAGNIPSLTADKVQAIPNFRTFSIKIPYIAPNITYKAMYKKSGTNAYRPMYPPAYIPQDSAYYTSATNTSENANYDVMIIPYQDNVAYSPINLTVKTLNKEEYDSFDPYFHKPNDILFLPTFENCSVYIPFDGEGALCNLQFRTADGKFEYAFPPIYDAKNKQFRGSIVELKDGTAYEVKAEIKQNGSVVKTYTGSFTTNTADVLIAETIKLSDVYKGGSLVLDNIKGKPDGWIKLVDDGKTVIDGGKRFGDKLSKGNYEAVLVSGCEYLIIEGLTVRGGGKNSINVANNSKNVRIINCDIADWGNDTHIAANVGDYQAAFVDANGSRVDYDAGVNLLDVSDILIEKCFIHDPRAKSAAWYGPPDGEDGVKWERAHPGGPTGIFARGRGGIVVRYNDIIGCDDHRWNDVICGCDNGYLYGSFARDSDIYGNMLSCAQDDAIELDGGEMNVRLYKNRMEQTYTNISLAPNMAGPSYIFKNLVYNGGDEYFAVSGHMKQGGGSTYGTGMSYIFNNTFEVDGTGIKDPGFGNDEDRQKHKAFAINNIVAVNKGTSAISDIVENGNYYDYNIMGSRTSAEKIPAIVNLTEYVQENAQYGLVSYANLKFGDFRLTEDSKNPVKAIDKGLRLPNFSNNMKGSAPDIGAFEFGDNSFLPYRPIDVTSDKYMIEGNDAFTIKTGNVGGNMSYKIQLLSSIKWLSVTPVTGTFADNSTYKFRVTIDEAKMTRGSEQTIFMVKLANGYSIPITVKATNANLPVIKSGH